MGRLTGTPNPDRITGLKGNDYMIGGGDADQFVFSKGDGFDRIGDFQPGVDHLVFNGVKAAQVTQNATVYSGVSGMDVTYGIGNTAADSHIFLEGVTAKISNADMIFQ